MLNRNIKSRSMLFIRKCLLDINKMKAELNEHRYYLERKIERRTEQLLKRLVLLESCNSTLCDKLAIANKELVALKQQITHALPHIEAEPKDRAAKLYVMNSKTRKPLGSVMQGNWDGHVAAN